MRVTRDFSRGLTLATLASQLPFAALALLRFVCRDDATRAQRPRVAPSRPTTAIAARIGVPRQLRSVSIGRLASRAHSPIEPS
jgi:hypothetical protein